MSNDHNNADSYISSNETQSAIPPWHGSSLPFFVVIRDQSTYTLTPSYTRPTPAAQVRRKDGLPNSNDNVATKDASDPLRRGSSGDASSPMTQQGFLTRNTVHMYPEIHYIFSDDDDTTVSNNPNSNTNEVSNDSGSSDNEVVTIVDFDKTGQSVISVNSISPNWQVTDVSMSASADQHWLDSTAYGDSSSPTLFITGIKNSSYFRKPSKTVDEGTIDQEISDGFDPLSSSDMKAPEYTDHLIQMLQDRNEQLRKTLLEMTLE